jgi:hypothetical protein
VAFLLNDAGNAILVLVPFTGVLLIKFKTLAKVNSVKIIPSVLAYTFKEPALSLADPVTIELLNV